MLRFIKKIITIISVSSDVIDVGRLLICMTVLIYRTVRTGNKKTACDVAATLVISLIVLVYAMAVIISIYIVLCIR